MEAKVWADLTLILLITLSMIIGIYRGFIRETLTLVTWIIAAVIGANYGQDLGDFFAFTESESMNFWIGFSFIFVSIVVIGFLLKIVVCKIMQISSVKPYDRVAGGLFGIARGVLLVLLILIVGAERFGKEDWYQEATLIGYFKVSADFVETHIPAEWRAYLK